jgi:hypothetical protein
MQVGSDRLKLLEENLDYSSRSLIVLQVGEYILKKVKPLVQSSLDVYAAAIQPFRL